MQATLQAQQTPAERVAKLRELLMQRGDEEMRRLMTLHDACGPRALYQRLVSMVIPSVEAVEDLTIAFYNECNARFGRCY